MNEVPINVFDLAVLIIVGLSALLSFFRGFMKEVLSLGAWVGASVITLIALPYVSKFLEPQVKSTALATAIGSVGTFFTVLVLISIVTGLLVKFIKTGAKIGLFDNLLGLAFGVARGVLIVAIGYFIMTIVVVEKDYPEWLKNAKTRPYVAKASDTIAKLTTDSINVLTNKEAKDKENEKKKLGEDQINKLIKKLDKAKDDTVEKVDEATDKMEEEADSMPSIEDLQRRIREENEKNDVR